MNLKVITAKSRQQIEQAFYIRKIVFVEEQHVPADEEIDHHEEDATHFLIITPDEKHVATSRIRFIDENTAKAERIAVLKEYRKGGIGMKLLQKMEEHAKEKQATGIILNAQVQAQGFYERAGYQAEGDTFMDAGIEHIRMRKKL
ncbi:GNAT family N-acetyltransferase [Mechercharimyces sp. CAU 1602]|uniref:GNAT family N-acetyltransferase n=1 Tax=Mechercharimyces sp. CAU 1602 TaxID=2973933 RepID=UPI002163B3A6|nr:GNAT family N-acetyltransferase [Mechercharimyces sp. CAU 1602]MCS1350563.1 GNAT family N-acetyltransferase [Mechercharimyces sp. CAU 1602]